jgi:tetratricopeptide (TPR) repeat protein
MMEVSLPQHACEGIDRGTAFKQQAYLSRGNYPRDQVSAEANVCVADWLCALDSIRNDQREQEHNTVAHSPPSQDVASTSETSKEAKIAYEDDLELDLAIAALDSGMRTFEASDWIEASSLLQEAVRILQLLPTQQRAFCDAFSLHYSLAVCAYHTQEVMDAEVALLSFTQQPANSDEQRICNFTATYLLSTVYLRTDRLDLARIECEKALQGRRRLLGKQNDASFHSTALMAHIYVLLNNRPRAKSYLNMIPEARRDEIIRSVEGLLGTAVEHLDLIAPCSANTGSERPRSSCTKRYDGILGELSWHVYR